MISSRVAQSFAFQKLCGVSTVPRPRTAEFERHKLRATRSALSGGCFILLACLSGACRRATTEAPVQPRDANVLLITLDTTRADRLSCYGPHGAETPHLDALAARGVRFVHATAQVPLTLPSHACIMTGAYPEVHGLRDMGGFVLAASHPTIASITSAAGFKTAAFVGSRVLARHFGISNGFETYDDDMGADTEEGKLPGVFPERRAAVVTDRALEWLNAHAQKRFFLWVHYYDPHAPYDPPEPYRERYAKDLYSGEIAYMDEQLGRLLDGLGRLGLNSRTLIVAIGDHGESLGEHGEQTHGIFLYDSTMRVPFIMAGPDVPAGKVIDEQVRSIDVMPTVLAFLGLSPGAEAEGASLWPLVEHGTKVGSDLAYLETLYPRTYMGWSELRGVRTNAWKYVFAPHPELYDLARDPQESSNVIAQHAVDAEHLQAAMWQAARVTPGKQEVASSPVSPETRRDLASLGYVSAGTPREITLGTPAPDPKDRVDVMNILTQVERRINAKSYPSAVQLMQRGLALDPANPMGHIYLAMAYERMGEYARAVQVYRDALERKVGTDQVYSRLGKDELRLHQLDAAIDAMTHANQINPTDLDNLRNLGTAELQLHRIDDAERAFKAITVQNDHYAAAYNGLGLVEIERGDGDGARRDFEKAIAIDPAEAEPLLNLGLLYKKAGQRQEAIHYFELFLAKAPKAQYGSMFGEVRAALGELERQ